MLEMINAPQWLINLWGIYGEIISPLLVTLVTAIVTALGIKIRSDARVNATKAELQLQALTKINDKEDVHPTVEKLQEKIDQQNVNIILLSEMFKIAFQNSDLTEDVKIELNEMCDKIKYGNSSDLIKELETEKADLEAKVESLQTQLDAKETKPTEVRQRRVRR